MDIIWIDPVVKGSCTSQYGCGWACCRVRDYSDAVNYTERWCEHFNQDPAVELKCTIYDTRPNGCARYPTPTALIIGPHHTNCGYYLEESANR
jgi:hypothetical protein